MEEIDFETFKENDGNPMVAVASDSRTFYRVDEDTLAVVSKYSDRPGNRNIGASILRPSSYFNGQFRVADSSFFTERKGTESAIDWIKNTT
jgi:hypothetical protein